MTFKLSNPDIVHIFRSPFAPAPEFEPLCSQFDGSDNFLVNCSQSTFCMTRTYRLQLRQGEGWRVTQYSVLMMMMMMMMMIFSRQPRRGDQRARLR